MAIHDPNPLPANALPFWTDGLNLWTRLPGPDNRPYLLRYPLTTSGLSSALGIIRTRAFDTLDRQPAEPAIRRGVGTPSQQSNATEVLRKLRLLP